MKTRSDGSFSITSTQHKKWRLTSIVSKHIAHQTWGFKPAVQCRHRFVSCCHFYWAIMANTLCLWLLKLRSGEVCDHKNLTISAKLCHPQIFGENFRALLQASWLLHSCNCTNTPAGYIEKTCLGMPVTNAMSEFRQQTANQISRSFPILALHRKQTRENPLFEFHILEVFSLW